MPSGADALRAFLDEAWKDALPTLQQRLGSKPERTNVDIRVVDGLLDSLTYEDDPIEALKLGRLREALSYEAEGRAPDNNLNSAFDEQQVQLYSELLQGGQLHKGAIFALAGILLAIESGAQRLLIMCGRNERLMDEAFSRAVSRLTAQPMSIDVAKELRAANLDYQLDLNPGRIRDADVLMQEQHRHSRESARALLLRNFPQQGRPVWVIYNLEELAVDVMEPAARLLARAKFWHTINRLADHRANSVRLYEFDAEANFFRHQEVSLKGAVFLLRTSQTRDALQSELKEHDLLRLAVNLVELKTVSAP